MKWNGTKQQVAITIAPSPAKAKNFRGVEPVRTYHRREGLVVVGGSMRHDDASGGSRAGHKSGDHHPHSRVREVSGRPSS